MIELDVAQLLVVDDNSLNRKKLRLAVESLGYTADLAKDGQQALEMIRERPYDLIVLDLLMPVMDGFEVLSHLGADEVLRDIPVVVISDLEDDADSVSRAIRLGAEDFLPKGFDPVILQARLDTCLRKKRFREKELQYFQRIGTLTDAAAQIETGEFDIINANALDKETVHNDPIGRLATVFRGMATEIHAREIRLLERIRFLQCSLILIVAASASGITPALSRMAAGLGSTPIGMAVWIFLIAAVVCITVAVSRGKMPRFKRSELVFLALWGFLVGALQQVGVYMFAAQVEATYLTMIMSLQGLFVFMFVAMLGNERATKRRIFGLLIGFLGVTIALFEKLGAGSGIALYWLLGAAIIPVIYAIETIGLASKRPKHIDPIAAVGVMFSFATLFVLPVALVSGQWIAPESLNSSLGMVILLLGIATIFANVALVYLVDLGGAVFSSQVAYGRVLAGIFWGILLLGEQLSWAAWTAIALILVGMYFVETKSIDKPVTIKRQYAGNVADNP